MSYEYVVKSMPRHPGAAPPARPVAAGAVGGDLEVSAKADELLAAARKAGWRSPGRGYRSHALGGGVYDAGGNLVCGVCTPCRNRARDECIAKNSSYAVARAAERARMRTDAAIESAYSTALQAPSGYSPVVEVGEGVQRDSERRTLMAMLESLG